MVICASMIMVLSISRVLHLDTAELSSKRFDELSKKLEVLTSSIRSEAEWLDCAFERERLSSVDENKELTTIIDVRKA